ncbi:hypothetical protein TRIUR3_22415 [Triticum urartu]|uniref:Uncharacterized protein n=1 Tax=Triticum urartu TaxID=4572 RepID=M7YPK5_TRIUA|nr:hypothetical protein TRIUR3_22415 [Triticum urartu]
MERPLPPLHSRAVPGLPQASAPHHQCAATAWSFQRQDSLVRHQLPPRLRGYFPPRCASDSVELQVQSFSLLKFSEGKDYLSATSSTRSLEGKRWVNR